MQLAAPIYSLPINISISHLSPDELVGFKIPSKTAIENGPFRSIASYNSGVFP
jgi:hypothetical protein